MTIGIIGAGGYLGRYVTDELLNRGETVVAFDTELSERLRERAEADAEFEAVRGDMTVFADLSDLITSYDVTDLVQLAYFGTPETGLLHAAEDHPYQASNVNVPGFANVVEAGRQFDLDTMVCASSTVVYGPPAYYEQLGVETVDETAPTNPESLYGACKVHNEYLADMYRREYDLDIACLRLPLIYGPQRYPGAQPFIVEMFERAAAGEEVTVSDGDSTWDLLYERDIGPLFAETLAAGSYEHTAYNIVGHTVTVRELAALAEEYGHPDAQVRVEEGDATVLPAPLDDDRLRSEVGFEPAYDARRAVEDYLETLGADGP